MTDFGALQTSQPFDVCVIGSGPAGTVVATELVERGVRTVLLEAGAGLVSWLSDSQIKSLAAYEVTGNADYPLKHTTSRIVGGNSNFWTGRCERFAPEDFEHNPYTPSENPWPIGYTDLDPYYRRAEVSLNVRGSFPRPVAAPPRNQPYPIESKADIKFLKRLFAGAGVEVETSPTATPRSVPRIFAVQREILPRFRRSGGMLVTRANAARLVPGRDGGDSIGSVEIQHVGGNGETSIVRAKHYVVACGGIHSPRLLLQSACERHPDGIGNAHDRVGRGFNEHPNLNFYAEIPHYWSTLTPTNKLARSHQFYTYFRPEGLGAFLPVFRQAWLLPHHVMPFRWSKVPRNVAAFFKRTVNATLFVGANIEMEIDPSNRVTLADRRDALGNPIPHLHLNWGERDLRLLDGGRTLIRSWLAAVGATNIREAEVAWSRHHQGTCRMGDSPTTSVVDRDLRVHGMKNLYVCGCEVFVTGGAMMPCLTIVALAHRLADHLVERLNR